MAFLWSKEFENNKDVTLIASSDVTKYQIFKYQNHAYGIQFHIEIKDTTVNEWGCVPEYKSALEKQLGIGALKNLISPPKLIWQIWINIPKFYTKISKN